MTMPAQNVEAAAGAGVLASEVLQDIWALSHHNVPRNATKAWAVAHGKRGGQPGYTELCESIAEFKRDSVMPPGV
jgi:hypothetical protein